MGAIRMHGSDFPLIQLNEDNLLDYSGSWQSRCVETNHSLIPRPFLNTRSINIYGTEIPVDTGHTHGMFPMERYLHEQPPFPGLLHTDFHRPMGTPPPPRFQSASFGYGGAQSPLPMPAEPRRAPSPGATSSSRSQSLSPYEEVKSTQFVQNYTYGSPPDSGYNSQPYPETDFYGHERYSAEQFLGGGSCIALQDIQGVPDQIPDTAIEEYGRGELKLDMEYYNGKMELDHGCLEEDGLIEGHIEAECVQYTSQDEGSDQEYKPCSRSTMSKRGRKRTLSQSSSGITPKRGGMKRGRGQSRIAPNLSANESGSRSKRVKRIEAASTPTSNTTGKGNNEGIRPFPCPLAIYSCNATFSSKNEWKRHVSTQHIRLGSWRCDLCPPSQDATQTAIYYNDFNRKDLFTQHLRRMHSSPSTNAKNHSHTLSTHSGGTVPPVNENTIPEHQTRCYQSLRSSPPSSSCLFCPRIFSGAGSWDERMEHVGRHLEKEGKGNIDPVNWREDRVLRNWLLKEGLIEKAGDKVWKLGDGVPRRDVRDEVVDSNDEDDEEEEGDDHDDDIDGECEEDDG